MNIDGYICCYNCGVMLDQDVLVEIVKKRNKKNEWGGLDTDINCPCCKEETITISEEEK